jgi:hypothetical protein
MTVEELHRKLHANAYRNTLPYARVGLSTGQADMAEVSARAKAYQTEEARLHAEFRADLESAYETTGNPKKDLLFSKAWDIGHSAGFAEVASYYGDLVELVR